MSDISRYIFKPSLPRPTYAPTYTLVTSTLTPNTTSSTPSPISLKPNTSSKTGIIAGASVGAFVLLAILATLFIILRRRRSSKRRAALEAAADPHIPPPNELPSYQDSKYNDPHAVEVSAYQEPLAFAPYRMQGAGVNEPAEMDADVHMNVNGEERDQWRPLSGESGLGLGMGRDTPGQTDSPRFSEISRESAGTASPVLGQGGRSPDPARMSRQSEVSRGSY